MPIEYRTGDLFTSGADCLVVPVNCVGVMGAGLAKQFKQRFSELEPLYQQLCRDKDLRLGRPVYTVLSEGPSVVLFPTKGHWRCPSRLSWIETGLNDLAFTLDAFGIASIAIPPLGCGLGGLEWSDVQPLIEQYLGPCSTQVLVYAPNGRRP